MANIKNKGLGMGLSALFGEDSGISSISSAPSSASGEGVSSNYNGSQVSPSGEVSFSFGDGKSMSSFRVKSLPISQIEPNPNQPRREFTESRIQELSASISENGVLQPILVRQISDSFDGHPRFEIIAGERRYRASIVADLQEIPCLIVENVDDKKILELALLENIQRKDLTPIEEAKAYKMLTEAYNCTHEVIAKTMGKSRAHVTNMLRILRLPDDVIKKIESQSINLNLGHLKVIVGTLNPSKWIDVAVSNRLTVRELEDAIANEIDSQSHMAAIEKVNAMRQEPMNNFVFQPNGKVAMPHEPADDMPDFSLQSKSKYTSPSNGNVCLNDIDNALENARSKQSRIVKFSTKKSDSSQHVPHNLQETINRIKALSNVFDIEASIDIRPNGSVKMVIECEDVSQIDSLTDIALQIDKE